MSDTPLRDDSKKTKGNPRNPLSYAEILESFYNYSVSLLDPGRINAVVSRTDHLENEKDIFDLIADLSG